MIVAVVPVAFFTQEHVDMTLRFLGALNTEVDRIGVWHNTWYGENSWPANVEDDWDAEGQRILKDLSNWEGIEVFDAPEWKFYRMWNAGAKWAQDIGADVALFLNNDITWPPGALRALAMGLSKAPPDIAVASPDPAADFDPGALVDINATPAYRGLMGWCFAIRPTYWQNIDERYHTWFGDDELGLLMHEAGWRCVRAQGIPVQHPPAGDTTMIYREDIARLRKEDQALYESKWSR